MSANPLSFFSHSHHLLVIRGCAAGSLCIGAVASQNNVNIDSHSAALPKN